MRVSNKDLKKFVEDNAWMCEDITTAPEKRLNEIQKTEGHFSYIVESYGTYGMNGYIIRGENTGKLYAVTHRTTNIFWRG